MKSDTTIGYQHERMELLKDTNMNDLFKERKDGLLNMVLMPLRKFQRATYIMLGCLMLLFGIIGIFLPIMPTTEFIIAATWFFARSSPRLEALILSHPKFGPLVRNWNENGVMPRRAKWVAWCGMTIGYISFVYHAHPSLHLAGLVAAFMISGATWIAFRPEDAPEIQSDKM